MSGSGFRRIAVVNRGEPAVRLITAVRELNAENGAGLRTIALHTEAERHAMFVREADEAVSIGGGQGNPYLDHDELAAALKACAADAAWVGWGFVAEDPEFAELCAGLGVVFIGPDAEVMRRLGDKIGAKRLAEQAGVPVAPWSGGPVETAEAAREHAEAIGYPLLVKAAAGGGGRGMRLVTGPDELAGALASARAEAAAAFGDATVFLERVVTGARHVEVQIVGDDHGTVWALGVRDCTVQRRNQKVMEESSSTALTAAQDRELRAAAVSLARLAGYRNAGTVEFLYQPAEGRFAFLEVNTRLQVEHPVTELTTGVDLVKLQLCVAGGGRLTGEPPRGSGHAIEARLNAEDPERGFAPAPGTVEFLQLPTGPGIRVDTGIAEGDVIPPEYDSMVAKVMAWGRDRPEALGRLRRALADTMIVLRGGTTNKSLLLELLDRPEIRAGDVDTGWLDRLAARGEHVPRRHADVALVAAAVDAADADAAVERARFYASAARGRPRTSRQMGQVVELRHRAQAYRLEVAHTGPDRYRVTVDGEAVDVVVERLRRFESRLWIGRTSYRVVSVAHGTERLVEVDGVAHRVSRDEGGVVRAMAPAVVVALNVRVGDLVPAGASVAVVESMKMEMAITAPFAGRVREVFVTSNVQVDAGAPLLQLEPVTDHVGGADHDTPRLSFAALAAPAADEGDVRTRCLDLLRELRHLVLGFDVGPADARRLVADYERARAALPPADPEVLQAELETLRTFADLCVLSRNRRTEHNGEAAELRRSEREYLDSYLRSLDVEAEGLPETFRGRLRRALRHYGVRDLDRTPELEQNAYRLYQALQRIPTQLPAVAVLLERRLAPGGTPPEPLRDDLRHTLDLLVAATQLRFPVIGDLARRVRYRTFDEPVIRQRQDEVDAGMRADLAYLSAHPDAPDYDERMAVLVDSPQPLIRLLLEGLSDDTIPRHQPLLEVLTRRYYKIRPLERFRTFVYEGRQFAGVEYRRGDRQVFALATHADLAHFAAAVRGVAVLAGRVPGPTTLVVDVYVRSEDPEPDADRLAERFHAVLAEAGLPRNIQRVAVAVASPGPVQHFTFERFADGFAENRVLRGLHPMVARRLALWRLRNFSLQRLPSADDLYAFQAVAHDNPRDERLLVLAEVRDLTPVLDAQGRVAGLPELEHVLARCFDALRQAQAGRPPNRRLEWNRVLLYVWPPVEAPPDELLALARTLAPATEGLGLEAVLVQGRFRQPDGGLVDRVVRVSNPTGSGLTVRLTDPPAQPLKPLDDYTQKVLRMRRRGMAYPYEIVPFLTGAGTFAEHDLDHDGRLVPVDRPFGRNPTGVIVGLVTTPTAVHPEGMRRVVVFGDPTKGLGALAEPECRRILSALDLADELGVPVEWFPVSSGAKVAMDSGTENIDWIGHVLRRLVRFTQAGGEVNVLVVGINVGGQSYWNAEATMLMHTRGILVMTPDSAMVLTGKQALEYSGGASAEDNVGIGGYERIMGPNGQAQYWAPDVAGACALLLSHYDHTYVAPGERFPRRAATTDPIDRDVRSSPHASAGSERSEAQPVPGSEFSRVGDVFSEGTNPGRKKPFDIRSVMRATIDADHPPLERWPDMAEAETAVVFDAHLGGRPVSVIGIESRPLPRHGFLPADGPDSWTAGTLFPQSSKKVARAINAASGNRPVVVLANLSGFDGSPESMRRLQLEYGAEIARAVVNFDGPLVFCVVSRYHGGAFAVFSTTLNDDLHVVAVEGAYASVIGGAPAAAVVFAGEVDARTRSDLRVVDLQARIAEAADEQKARLQAELAGLTATVRSERLGEVAAEFDAVHDIERARRVGSVHEIIPAARLRPYLVDAVERGIASTLSKGRDR